MWALVAIGSTGVSGNWEKLEEHYERKGESGLGH